MERLISWVVALAASGLPFVAAMAEPTDAVGGRGGVPVNFVCPDGRFLAGFDGFVGDWLDHAGLLCVGVDRDGRWTGAPTHIAEVGLSGGDKMDFLDFYDPRKWSSKPFGVARTGGVGFGASDGGNPFMLACPRDHLVVGLGGMMRIDEGNGGLVARLALDCLRFADGKEARITISMPIKEPIRYQPLYNVRCRGQEIANGAFGRAGKYVDNVGLNCAILRRKPTQDDFDTRRRHAPWEQPTSPPVEARPRKP